MGNTSKKLVKINDLKLFQLKWNLTEDEIKSAFIKCTQDKVKIQHPLTPKDNMKLFLYCKNVVETNSQIRKITIKNLFKERGPPFNRLLRIVEIGEVSSNENCFAFDNFILRHPEWNEHSNSFIVFRDHSLLKNKDIYVERIQKSGLCFIHGPSLLCYMLCSMYAPEKLGMIDISEFLRRDVGSDLLKSHIYSDSGGSSVDILKHFLGPNSQEDFLRPDIMSSEIPLLLEKYGPALVSTFEVFDCFYDSSITSHTNKPQGKSHGHHSMVLIGYRKNTMNGETRYLLQNFWIRKVFVEVDANYLKSCGAIFTFSTATNTTMSNSFTFNYNKHVEASYDCCEQILESSKKPF